MLNIYMESSSHLYNSPKTSVTSPHRVSIKPLVVGDNIFMQTSLNLQQDIKEILIPIKGFSRYRISNLGNVFNTKPQNKSPYPLKLKPQNTNGSTLCVTLRSEGVSKQLKIPRLVASHFIKNPQNFKYVKHIDGDFRNNRIDNLIWTNNKKESIIYSENLIKCSDCHQNKFDTSFRDILKGKVSFRSICAECLYKKRKEKYGNKFKSYRDRQHFIEKTTLSGRANLLFNRCKRRARVDSIELDISKEDIIQALSSEKCEITGIPFVLENSLMHPYSPSIDRILNEKGYVKGNIQAVCMIYNYCKNQFKEEDVDDFIKSFYNNKFK